MNPVSGCGLPPPAAGFMVAVTSRDVCADFASSAHVSSPRLCLHVGEHLEFAGLFPRRPSNVPSPFGAVGALLVLNRTRRRNLFLYQLLAWPGPCQSPCP